MKWSSFGSKSVHDKLLMLFSSTHYVSLCWRAIIIFINMQIIDTFLDSVMSVCLTKTEIIAGSVDGTIRTFDIRIGR